MPLTPSISAASSLACADCALTARLLHFFCLCAAASLPYTGPSPVATPADMPDIAEAAAAPDPRDPLGSADGERTATAASAAHDSAAAGAAAPPELATAVPGGTAERTGDAGANAPSYGPQGAAATGTTAVTPDKLKSHLEQLRSHLEQLRSHMPRAPEDAQGTHKHTNTRARAHTHTHSLSLSLSLSLS